MAMDIGQVQAAIANGCVGLMREYTGRGPTSSRAEINRHSVVVTLFDQLTKGERTMAANGQSAQVLAMRRELQNTMRPELVRLIEGLTGLTVIAFLSDNLYDPDIAVEVFVISPKRQSTDSTSAKRTAIV